MVDVGKSLKKSRSKPSPLKSRTIIDLSQGAVSQILVKHWKDFCYMQMKFTKNMLIEKMFEF